MHNILQLSIETAKRDLIPEPLLYCITCSKPRVKGDYQSCYYCSESCSTNEKFNYCIICNKKLNEQYSRDYPACSIKCYSNDVFKLWNKIND
jgi:hypothetical protein